MVQLDWCLLYTVLFLSEARAQTRPAISDGIQEMATKSIGLMVGVIIVGVVFHLVVRKSAQVQKERLEELSRPLAERKAGSTIGEILGQQPKRAIDLVQLTSVLPEFTIEGFRDTARMMFEAAQQARPGQDASVLGSRFTDGAREVAFLAALHAPFGDVPGHDCELQGRFLHDCVLGFSVGRPRRPQETEGRGALVLDRPFSCRGGHTKARPPHHVFAELRHRLQEESQLFPKRFRSSQGSQLCPSLTT